MSSFTKDSKLAEELPGKVDEKCNEMLQDKLGEITPNDGEPLGKKSQVRRGEWRACRKSDREIIGRGHKCECTLLWQVTV